MPRPIISYSTRKALEVQLGEDAAREVVTLLQKLADGVTMLEKKKVDVTPIAPAASLDLLESAHLRAAE
jgi:hypothetical protein